MITYMYRTNTHCGEVVNKDEALCALDVIEFSKNEESDSRKERTCIEVADSGEHHDGLTLTVQAYIEDVHMPAKWVKKFEKGELPKDKSYFNLCHMYLSPRQGKELIEAIQHALDMRKYDDENEEETPSGD